MNNQAVEVGTAELKVTREELDQFLAIQGLGLLLPKRRLPMYRRLLESTRSLLESRRRKQRTNPRVHYPPGARLARIANFLYPPKTVDRVFDEILGNLTDEYREALIDDQAQDRRYIRKATWVRIRGYASFWSAALLQVWVSGAKRIFEIWKLIG